LRAVGVTVERTSLRTAPTAVGLRFMLRVPLSSFERSSRLMMSWRSCSPFSWIVFTNSSCSAWSSPAMPSLSISL